MKALRIVLLFTLLIGIVAGPAAAASKEYRFDQEASHLEGAIKYAVVGTYEARFGEFEGTLHFDERRIENSTVELRVHTDSIRSRYPRLDRIVRSPRLLDAAAYPYITFKSRSIRKVPEGYQIDGRVQLHSITKDFTFNFVFEGPYRAGDETYIRANGQWIINRKDFDIIWNRWLDHGGVVVGDNITVDWEILAFN